jgi:hypothetical protein
MDDSINMSFILSKKLMMGVEALPSKTIAWLLEVVSLKCDG